MADSSITRSDAATRGVVPMNALQRLIRSRMAELNISFRDIETRGGIPWTTVSALVNKTEHRQVPRKGTLEKLAKGLDLPLDLVRMAAAEAAGYQLQEIPTTLDAAEDVRIVAAAMANMTASDRAKLRRLAMAFQSEIEAEEASDAKEQ